MFSSTKRVRLAAVILAVAAVGLAAACEPVKKSPPKDVPPAAAPKAGENIGAYFVIDGTPTDANTTRSTSPFSAPFSNGQGTASQALHANGSVTLKIDGNQANGTGTTGFNLKFRRLGDIANVTVKLTGGSNQVRLSLLFDMNGDGSFTYASDKFACGPQTVAGALTVNNQTSFQMECSGGHFTLAQLKSGANNQGINANTPVAIVVALGPIAQANENANVNSLAINGSEMLVP